jgi:RNA recognition motif-containing protein
MTVVGLTVTQLMRSGAAAAGTGTASVDKPQTIAYSKSLLLRKVPRKSTESDIRTVFEGFGSVRDVYVPTNVTTGRKETYAFIEFTELRDAITAYNFLKDTEILLEGIILRADFARNGRRSPEEMVQRPSAA